MFLLRSPRWKKNEPRFNFWSTWLRTLEWHLEDGRLGNFRTSFPPQKHQIKHHIQNGRNICGIFAHSFSIHSLVQGSMVRKKPPNSQLLPQHRRKKVEFSSSILAYVGAAWGIQANHFCLAWLRTLTGMMAQFGLQVGDCWRQWWALWLMRVPGNNSPMGASGQEIMERGIQ